MESIKGSQSNVFQTFKDNLAAHKFKVYSAYVHCETPALTLAVHKRDFASYKYKK